MWAWLRWEANAQHSEIAGRTLEAWRCCAVCELPRVISWTTLENAGGKQAYACPVKVLGFDTLLQARFDLCHQA